MATKMIDSHMHLNQPEYDRDRSALIGKWKAAGLKAIINCSASVNTLDKGLEIRKKWPDFVFLTAAIHPEYVKGLDEKQVDDFIEKVRKHSGEISGIGETGLDYFWIKEPELREKQKRLFTRFIALSKELDKPLLVHTRDAYPETIELLKQQGVKRAQLHMWGNHALLNEVISNGWMVSIGPILLSSKSYQKVARDLPLELLMLETDSPWFGGKDKEGQNLRGEPTNIRAVAEKIAQIKKIPFEDVWTACGRNAVRFYRLPLRL